MLPVVIALGFSMSAAHPAAAVNGSLFSRFMHTNTPPAQIDFKGAAASDEVRLVAAWIRRDNKHKGQPFIIAAKADGLLFAFNESGKLLARTPALFGAMYSDVLTEKQADKTLDEVLESDKITPAGVFPSTAYLSPSYGESVRFAGYAHTNLLIHRAPDAKRLKRLQSATISDNRITFGCINALPEFVDRVLLPHFSQTSTVFVLPETQSAALFFAISDAGCLAPQAANGAAHASNREIFLRHARDYLPAARPAHRDPARTPQRPEDEKYRSRLYRRKAKPMKPD